MSYPLDPTQDEIEAAKARIAALMPTVTGAWAQLYPWLCEMVEWGATITPDEWANADPQARGEYETLKAIYYAAETAKEADE